MKRKAGLCMINELKPIQRFLVCNYYETHGSFAGIENTFLSRFVQTSSQLLDVNKCYGCLGYEQIQQFSPRQVHDLKVAVLMKDIDILQEMNFRYVEDAQAFLEVNEDPVIPISNDNTVRISGNKRYCDLLVSYFSFNKSIVVPITMYSGEKPKPLYLGKALQYVRLAGKGKAKLLLNEIHKVVNNDLISFQVSENGKDFVCDNVVYTKEQLKGDTNKIIMDALRVASSKPLDQQQEFEDLKNFLLFKVMQGTLPLYKQLIEYVDSHSMTYSNLCSVYGVNNYYALDVYLHTGMIPYIMGDKSILYLSDFISEEMPYDVMSAGQFVDRMQDLDCMVV